MSTVMDLLSKVSPRAIGNNIKRRVSSLAVRHGSPQARIRGGLTKISKVAKETRFKKRELYNFSATALLMISQNGQSLLHHAVDQIFKPVARRGLGILPFPTQEILQTPSIRWAEQAKEQAHAHQPEIRKIPTIIVTSPSGVVKDSDMLPPWEYIKRSNDASMKAKEWESSMFLSPVWRSRGQIRRWQKMKLSIQTRRERRNQIRDVSLKQPRVLPRKREQPVVLPMKRHHSGYKAREESRKGDEPLISPRKQDQTQTPSRKRDQPRHPPWYQSKNQGRFQRHR
ncbi:hypothetical protein ACHAQJ_001725 [Trichoderma viride]